MYIKAIYHQIVSNTNPLIFVELNSENYEPTRITDHAMKLLCESLQASQCRLQAMFIYDKPIIKGALNHLVAALPNNETLKALSFVNTKLHSTDIMHIANALSYNKTLNTLCLSANSLNSDDLKVLGLGIQDSGVETLMLADCDINDETAIVLAQALENTQLKKLVLNTNNINRKGAAALQTLWLKHTDMQITLEKNPAQLLFLQRSPLLTIALPTLAPRKRPLEQEETVLAKKRLRT